MIGKCCGGPTTTAATFEGASGFAADETEIFNLPDCKINLQETSTNYYDSNYSPIGAAVPNSIYTKFQSLPSPLPDTAKIGDSADFETLTTYSDNTKTTLSGKLVVSYALVADTPSTTTALVNFTTKHLNETNQLQSTTVYQYRIGTDGSIVPLSFSIQNSVGTDNYFFKKQ